MWEQSHFKLYSWTLEDYKEAIKNDEFFRNVEDKLPPYCGKSNAEKEQRAQRVQDKYFLAGGSARVMFDFDSIEGMNYLEYGMWGVSNIEACAKMLSGDATTSAANRLLAVYRSGDDDEYQLVSRFVYRALAIKLGPDLLKNFAALHGVNPSVDGYIFEAWFFAELAYRGVSWSDKNDTSKREQWKRSRVKFFDPLRPIGNYLNEAQKWMAPLKWSQAGYDAVFVDTNEKLVRFVQVTRAKSHGSFLHDYFVVVLNNQAAVEGLHPFKKVEMCFVVPRCNLTTFRVPTDQLDFQNNILNVATWPERSTRESKLPFASCKMKILVIGVDYDSTQ